MKKERNDMLIDIAKQQLRKAGWYEGRKIDLTKYEKAYAEVGCKLFPAARKFLEEYGDLDIQDKYISTATYENGDHFIVINRSLIDVAYCCYPRDLELEKMVDELFHQKILRVGAIDHGNIDIYISEDGRFFVNWYNYGLWAENSDQLWNEYYGEDYGWELWDDVKAGKGRTMRKKQIEKYL